MLWTSSSSVFAGIVGHLSPLSLASLFDLQVLLVQKSFVTLFENASSSWGGILYIDFILTWLKQRWDPASIRQPLRKPSLLCLLPLLLHKTPQGWTGLNSYFSSRLNFSFKNGVLIFCYFLFFSYFRYYQHYQQYQGNYQQIIKTNDLLSPPMLVRLRKELLPKIANNSWNIFNFTFSSSLQISLLYFTTKL